MTPPGCRTHRLVSSLLGCWIAMLIVGCASGQDEPPSLNHADGGQTGYELFLLLNRPAAPGVRGTSNPQAKFGTGPVVWETLKNTTEIYRDGGVPPCPWPAVCEFPEGVTPLTTAELQKKLGPANSTWLHFLSSSRMIDGQQVVDGKNRPLWYDVRCNQQFFEYIAANPAGYPLYNIEGQEAARKDDDFSFSFPAGSIEVKAAWKVLDTTDDDSRFWTAYGAYYDDDQSLQYARIALTAFHIIHRDADGWIWLTYEQVDNPAATFTCFLQEKGEPVGKNPTLNPRAASYNAQIRSRCAGTKWQFYQMIGWQTDEADASGQPVLLANMNIETYFPQTSSCKSCHAMANIGPGDDRRLNMWDMTNGIEGRIGNVDFQEIARELSPFRKYKQTDYAWSLREAHSTGARDTTPDSASEPRASSPQQQGRRRKRAVPATSK